jgi:hypothetical protein
LLLLHPLRPHDPTCAMLAAKGCCKPASTAYNKRTLSNDALHESLPLLETTMALGYMYPTL